MSYDFSEHDTKNEFRERLSQFLNLANVNYLNGKINIYASYFGHVRNIRLIKTAEG